jgi:hypothetical protein
MSTYEQHNEADSVYHQDFEIGKQTEQILMIELDEYHGMDGEMIP